MTPTIADRLAAVEARIEAACRRSGRARDEVRLLPVSKTQPASVVREAYAAGLRQFGENRIQELAGKAAQLGDLDVDWVVIGHVQRNKAGKIAPLVRELQSLDSVRLAEDLDRRLAEAGRTLDVLVQVNTSGEAQKSGVALDEAVAFGAALTAYPALVPRGLMTIAVFSTDPDEVGACFDRLRDVQTRLRDATGTAWDDLSMGMSGDLELAIERGSTCVRVGTALFGARSLV